MRANTRQEINVIIQNGNELNTDKDILFPGEEVWFMSKETTFADILAKGGVFKSKGDARNNGWNKPIPPGFSEYRIGSLKHWVCIFNPIPFVDSE